MTYDEMMLAKRAAIHEQSKAIIDKAETEKRDFTVEEQTALDGHDADMRAIAAKVAASVERRAEEAAYQKTIENMPKVKPGEQRGGDVDNEAFRAELRSYFMGNGAQALDVADKRYELRDMLAEPGGRGATAKRALSKLTSPAGAYTVPTSFYGKLWANLILTANLINAGATVWTTDSGEAMQVPITLSHSTAALVAEASVIPPSDPVFGQRALGAYKYGTLFQVSRELIADTGVDIEAYLSMQAGRAVGNALGLDLVSGNGAAKPSGIMQTAANAITGAAGVGGAPSFDNLIDLYYSVIPPYRKSDVASWLINDTTGAVIRKLKDTTGRYLWEPTLTPGAPDVILGKAVVTDPGMPAVALGAKSVLFGDLSAYVARIVNGVRFESSTDFAFSSDLVTYKCVIRGDGVLIDQSGAVKTFTGNAA